jgi:hypothetical protein
VRSRSRSLPAHTREQCRRQLANVLALSDSDEFRSTITMLKIMENTLSQDIRSLRRGLGRSVSGEAGDGEGRGVEGGAVGDDRFRRPASVGGDDSIGMMGVRLEGLMAEMEGRMVGRFDILSGEIVRGLKDLREVHASAGEVGAVPGVQGQRQGTFDSAAVAAEEGGDGISNNLTDLAVGPAGET